MTKLGRTAYVSAVRPCLDYSGTAGARTLRMAQTFE